MIKLYAALLLCSVFQLTWAAPTLPARIDTAAIPPDVHLLYRFHLKQGLITASGDSTITWAATGSHYTTTTNSQVSLFGNVLKVSSTGHISSAGLQSTQFDEKSFLKKQRTLQFNADNSYTRVQDQQRFEIQPPVYDRASIIWQLSLLLNTDETWAKPQARIEMNVAEPNGSVLWSFIVIGSEQLDTPLGNLPVLHIRRLPNHRQQTVDIWFAPTYHWYPLQIYFNEADGSYFQQTIRQIALQ